MARHLLSWEAKRFAKIALVETRFDESAPGRLRKIRGADYLSLFPDFRLPDGLALGLWGAVERNPELWIMFRCSPNPKYGSPSEVDIEQLRVPPRLV